MLCVCLATPDILADRQVWVGNVRARWAWVTVPGRRLIGFRIHWYMIPQSDLEVDSPFLLSYYQGDSSH